MIADKQVCRRRPDKYKEISYIGQSPRIHIQGCPPQTCLWWNTINSYFIGGQIFGEIDQV
jgi:Ni,Fe-hydrogenase I small subunit